MTRIFLLCWTLLFGFSAVEAQAASKKALTEQQIKQLSGRISTLQEKLRQQEGESRQLSQALKDSEVEIGRLARQLKKLDQQLGKLGQNATQLEGRRDELKQALAQRADLIARQIRQQYKMGEQARLQLLLTQRDPEQLDRTLRYYDAINTELSKDMQQFRQQLDELGGTERKLGETEQEMVATRSEIAQELQALKHNRDLRKQTLAQLKKTLSADVSQLKQLQLDQKRLQALLEEISRSLNIATLVKDNKAFSQLKGKLPWPLKGRVKQKFGSQINNIRYDGIWVQAPEAAQVRAVHHGRVVFADWLRGYGLVLIIDHGGGYMSLYGYNQSLMLETGDWVAAGDVVATVGSSGGREQNGLYFAIRHKGKPTDPQSWLGR